MFAGAHGNESFALGCDDVQIPANRLGNLNKAVMKESSCTNPNRKYTSTPKCFILAMFDFLLSLFSYFIHIYIYMN